MVETINYTNKKHLKTINFPPKILGTETIITNKFIIALF